MMKKMSLIGALVICVSALVFVGVLVFNAEKETSFHNLDEVAKFYIEHEHSELNNVSYEINYVYPEEIGDMSIDVYEDEELAFRAVFNIDYYKAMLDRKDS